MSEFQFEFNGLTFGRDTEYPVNRVEGIFSRQGNIQTPDLPRQHGGFVGASYEDPRRITIEMEVHGDQDDGSFATRRDTLMATFDPYVDSEGEFKFTLPGWPEARLVLARPVRGGSPVDIQSEMGHADFIFEMLASDPSIYADNLKTLTLTPFVSAAGLSYPVTYPKSYGSGGSGGGGQIDNDGKWDSWPVIEIDGPSSGTLTDPVIEHLTSGLFLSLTAFGGVSITSGQTLVIDSHPARRSIAFSSGASRYGRLSDSSDWFPLTTGTNELRFRASGSTGGAEARVMARDAWI